MHCCRIGIIEAEREGSDLLMDYTVPANNIIISSHKLLFSVIPIVVSPISTSTRDTHLVHAWGFLLNPLRFCSINNFWIQANPGEGFPGT